MSFSSLLKDRRLWLVLAAIASLAHSQQLTPEDLHILRVAKCAAVWKAMAPWSYSQQIVAHFIGEHERLGIGSEWFSSFTYGFANFGLTVGKRAPGLCYGPMDVKWGGSHSRRAGARRPDDLRNWRINITAHCLEAQEGVRRGHEGLALCRWIMYPAAPTDWGGGRFRRTWARGQSVIADWYCSRATGE
jgi:hypothetical protein